MSLSSLSQCPGGSVQVVVFLSKHPMKAGELSRSQGNVDAFFKHQLLAIYSVQVECGATKTTNNFLQMKAANRRCGLPLLKNAWKKWLMFFKSLTRFPPQGKYIKFLCGLCQVHFKNHMTLSYVCLVK